MTIISKHKYSLVSSEAWFKLQLGSGCAHRHVSLAEERAITRLKRGENGVCGAWSRMQLSQPAHIGIWLRLETGKPSSSPAQHNGGRDCLWERMKQGDLLLETSCRRRRERASLYSQTAARALCTEEKRERGLAREFFASTRDEDFPPDATNTRSNFLNQ